MCPRPFEIENGSQCGGGGGVGERKGWRLGVRNVASGEHVLASLWMSVVQQDDSV